MSTTLLHGDCLELMRDIPDGSVDMVLCDLPYGVTQNEWDSVIPFDALWDSYGRVCKKNAAIVLFGQMPFTAKMVMSNISNYRYSYVWNKKIKTGFLNANVQPLRHLEDICVFYGQKCTYNPIMTKGVMRRKGGGAVRQATTGIFTNWINMNPTHTIHPNCLSSSRPTARKGCTRRRSQSTCSNT